jgi:cadaverine:lysine antiporter
MSSDSTKRIGLIACTGLVAGNMMGSGIALLPSSLAAYGSITIFSWMISLVGALALAYVYARMATTNPQAGGPVAPVKLPRFSVSKPGFFTTMRTGSVT